MKRKLLIVEDREEFYEPLATALNESYELNFARKSEVAERALQKYAYDAVLTDVHFGENDPLGGIKIASLASSRNIPCLVMSTGNYRKGDLDAGAYGFLFKRSLLPMLRKGKNLSCLFINGNR